MNPYYQGKLTTIYHGDCRELSLENITALVTDPPYELGFMGKDWDKAGVSFQRETWQHLRGLCLSGAPLLSFGGTRTFHRIACAIEDAGWEIRDTLMWVYGSGFPKSLDISKAIDKSNGRLHYFDIFRRQLRQIITEKKITQQSLIDYFGSEVVWHWFGNSQPQIPSKDKWVELKQLLELDDSLDIVYEQAVREIIGEREDFVKRRCKREPNSLWNKGKNFGSLEFSQKQGIITTPATPEAQLWEGYGTALKPAYEPIILGMNPLDGTFAENALKHKVAGLNIDECRIGTEQVRIHGYKGNSYSQSYKAKGTAPELDEYRNGQGRFPANFIHDGSQLVLELFPSPHGAGYATEGGQWGNKSNGLFPLKSSARIGDNGSAARFFYCAKASKAERDRGLDDLVENRTDPDYRPNDNGDAGLQSRLHGATIKGHNNHPTVKPLALMKYLVKLVKMPEYNLVLDPFMGSGTTLLACIRLGIPCIGIDNNEHTCEIAARRCANEIGQLVCT